MFKKIMRLNKTTQRLPGTVGQAFVVVVVLVVVVVVVIATIASVESSIEIQRE